MKLYLESGKSIDVDFWSFMKCAFLTQLALSGIIYGFFILLWLILGIAFIL